MPEGEQGGAGKEGCCDTATYTTGGKRELRDKPEGEQGGASKEGRARRDEQGGTSKEGRARRVAVIQQHTQLEQKGRLNKAGKRDL